MKFNKENKFWLKLTFSLLLNWSIIYFICILAIQNVNIFSVKTFYKLTMWPVEISFTIVEWVDLKKTVQCMLEQNRSKIKYNLDSLFFFSSEIVILLLFFVPIILHMYIYSLTICTIKTFFIFKSFFFFLKENIFTRNFYFEIENTDIKCSGDVLRWFRVK